MTLYIRSLLFLFLNMSHHVNRHPTPFIAHLAPGSDPDLTISPTSGNLAPVNTRGTLFCITYTPTSYGRNHHGTLIVQVCTGMYNSLLVFTDFYD